MDEDGPATGEGAGRIGFPEGDEDEVAFGGQGGGQSSDVIGDPAGLGLIGTDESDAGRGRHARL
jgi:hypothetical protein